MDICVAFIFALWLLISIVWQFQFKSLTAIKEFDFIGIFPNWTFFAPNPGTSDYHIVYRLAQNETIISEWIEIPLISYTNATHLQFTLVESFGIESTESAKPIISSPFHRVR